MVSINFTLILQAIHFFCAYCIIKYGILKPVLAVIFARKSQEQSLHNEIATLKKEITEKENEQRAIWTECHHLIAQKLENSTRERFMAQRPITPIAAPEITDDAIAAQEQFLVNAIIKAQEK